jgi:pantetheine-phosphate adenylyltransferase
MTNHRKAIYGGSFDPITNGHIWVIEKGLQLFDHLIIAIGVNPKKSGYFSVDERVDMIQEYLMRTGYDKFASVITFRDDFLVNKAKEHGCDYMLRGIRNATDFAYELEIKQFNDELDPTIETVFVVPPASLAGRSSSIVRGCVGLKNWESVVNRYTTDYVTTKFKERIQANH